MNQIRRFAATHLGQFRADIPLTIIVVDSETRRSTEAGS